MARPIVDQGTCTGCGACVDLCPEVFELRGDKAQAAEGGMGRKFYMIKEDPADLQHLVFLL